MDCLSNAKIWWWKSDRYNIAGRSVAQMRLAARRQYSTGRYLSFAGQRSRRKQAVVVRSLVMRRAHGGTSAAECMWFVMGGQYGEFGGVVVTAQVGNVM